MAYDKFHSIAAAKAAYRRVRRKVRHFILADGSADDPPCFVCRRPVFDFSGTDANGKAIHPPGYRGNRCEYHPSDKSVTAYHYVCSWEDVMKRIANCG